MMRHRHDQALALAERAVALHEHSGSLHGLAVALATLGQICVQARRPHARRGSAAPRARRPQPGAVPRDHRRGLRHARADSPDPRRLRRGGAVPAPGRRRLRRLRRAGQPLVRMVGAPADGPARAAAGPARRGAAARDRDRRNARRAARRQHRRPTSSPPRRCSATAASKRPSVAWGSWRRGSTRGSRPAPGATTCACGPRSTRGAAAPPTRTTTSRRARACSTCSASATRRRRAAWRSGAWCRAWARGRPPSATCARRSPSSRPWAPGRTSRKRGRTCRRCPRRPAASTSSAPGEADDVIVRRLVDAAVMPDLLALETASALLEASGGDAARHRPAVARRRPARARIGRLRCGRRVRPGAVGAQGRGLRRRRADRRSARPRTRRGASWHRGLATARRAGHHPAPAHDRRRRAPGVRAVRAPRNRRPAGRARGPADRSTPSCPASSAPAPR